MPPARRTAPPSALPGRPLATPREVADYLGVSVDTLKDWRLKKTGPSYTPMGRHVRYDWSDVNAWVKTRKVGTRKVSTRQEPAA